MHAELVRIQPDANRQLTITKIDNIPHPLHPFYFISEALIHQATDGFNTVGVFLVGTTNIVYQ